MISLEEQFPFLVSCWGKPNNILHQINWLNEKFGVDAAGELWECIPSDQLRFKYEKDALHFTMRWS